MQFNRTHGTAPVAGQVRFLSVVGATRLFGMSEVTLYRAIREEQFPAVKVHVPSQALDAMEEAAVVSGGMVDAPAWATPGGEIA